MRKIGALLIARITALWGFEFRRITPRNQFLNLLRSLWPYESRFELIRVGEGFDGVYLIPDCLDGNEILISPGVGSSTSFELNLHEKFGISSILIDPTINPPTRSQLPPESVFISKYLGVEDDEKTITLDQIYRDFGKQKDLVLQIDIEGMEYLSLLCASNELLSKTKVLVVEFHNLNYWTNLLFYQNVAKPLFDKLNNSFFPVHLKANSVSGTFRIFGYEVPKVIEVTYISKSVASKGSLVKKLPHPLDVANVEGGSLLNFPSV